MNALRRSIKPLSSVSDGKAGTLYPPTDGL